MLPPSCSQKLLCYYPTSVWHIRRAPWGEAHFDCDVILRSFGSPFHPSMLRFRHRCLLLPSMPNGNWAKMFRHLETSWDILRHVETHVSTARWNSAALRARNCWVNALHHGFDLLHRTTLVEPQKQPPESARISLNLTPKAGPCRTPSCQICDLSESDLSAPRSTSLRSLRSL